MMTRGWEEIAARVRWKVELSVLGLMVYGKVWMLVNGVGGGEREGGSPG